MPYTKIDPERLKPGHKGDLGYLVGQKVKARIVQVRCSSSNGVLWPCETDHLSLDHLVRQQLCVHSGSDYFEEAGSTHYGASSEDMNFYMLAPGSAVQHQP